ncbi:hypothetical protein [Nocardioides sp. GXZ039]|uniref:hypothetical protein n=1 Tax=Nocardioides sp. GXZ039 TaxID=3136018 RepID=UPI0030F3ADE9
MSPHTHQSDENAGSLRERMSRSLDGLSVPGDLPGAVLTAGRRARRRRRLAATGGTLGVAALAVAVVWPLAGGADDPTPVGSPEGTTGWATSPDPGQASVPGATTSDPGVPTPGIPQYSEPAPGEAHGWWNRTARQMFAVLEERLPEDMTIEDAYPEFADQVGVLVVRTDSPVGRGTIELRLSAPGERSNDMRCEAYAWAWSKAERDLYNAECRELTDAGGEVVGRVISTDAREAGGQLRDHTVELRTEDGGIVSGSVANTVDEKWYPNSPASAELPPLTVPQIENLLRDPIWTTGES